MPSFTKFCVVVVIAMGVLTACGNSKPATNDAGHGTSVVISSAVNLVGTLDGKAFAWKDVASAVITSGSTQQLVLVVSDAADVCAAVGAGTATDANLLVIRVAESSGAVTAGPHPVSTTASVGGEHVTISLESAGSTLAATGGTVAISFVASDNSAPAVLVVTATDGGNTLSGSLQAPACAALQKGATAY